MYYGLYVYIYACCLQSFLLSNKMELREYVAELYALVFVYGADVSTLNDAMKQLSTNLEKQDNQVWKLIMTVIVTDLH